MSPTRRISYWFLVVIGAALVGAFVGFVWDVHRLAYLRRQDVAMLYIGATLCLIFISMFLAWAVLLFKPREARQADPAFAVMVSPTGREVAR